MQQYNIIIHEIAILVPRGGGRCRLFLFHRAPKRFPDTIFSFFVFAVIVRKIRSPRTQYALQNTPEYGDNYTQKPDQEGAEGHDSEFKDFKCPYHSIEHFSQYSHTNYTFTGQIFSKLICMKNK